ncbi:MAG TPA: DUF3750 domain-containing protein [Xanthobacteraceae bacterium]|nr:DUF3750 domain-containing protein [Xanthobacteraceae bacterium]
MRFRVKTIAIVLAALFLVPVAMRGVLHYAGDHPRSWRDADWSSAGLLPPAAQDPPARVLVMAGRTGGWKSVFAVHTWIVVKPDNAASYTRYDLTGFGRLVHVNGWAADARWFGYTPHIVADIRGPAAAVAIPKIEAAVAHYPLGQPGDYRMWPGPNSNTFVATVLRAVPELAIAMPPEAVGRDFRVDGAFYGLTNSETGIEANFWGLLGIKLGWVEGVEVNLLTLVAGLDVRHPAVKLPGFGRIGIEATAPTATAKPR